MSTRTLFLLALLFAAALPAAQAAPGRLLLERGMSAADAWPVVTILPERDRALTPTEVAARRNEFATPRTPHANLGPRRTAVWVRLPVEVARGAPARWMLDIDYASIDRIELYVDGPTGVAPPVIMGRTLAFSERPWPSAAHAVPLELEPGRTYELLMRVTTTSTMVLPISLSTPESFAAREGRNQALQGLIAGIAVWLLIHSLTQWVGLRDRMFLFYALTLVGTIFFFVAYFGVGPQYLWGDNAWLTARCAPLAILVGALPGGFLFIDSALAVRQVRPWISLAMRAGAGVAWIVGAAFAAGLVEYRVAQLSATILGPMPMLLTIPVAWTRARNGERIGTYLLLGWGVYALGTITMAGLLRGFVPVDFLSQHAFQFCCVFEMMVWMRVLGVRIEELRDSAQRAHIERDALRSLAHADPLTGLPNRRGLNESLATILPACRPDRPAAVFLLDLDGFKPVNDRLGHDAGDEVLIGVAKRLRAMLRADDIVARLGGDEFVVVAAGLRGDDEARSLGQKMLDAFAQPFDAGGQLCSVGLTIGYALSPHDGKDPAGLLKRADAAMYAGKQNGRHCLRRGVASVGLAEA